MQQLWDAERARAYVGAGDSPAPLPQRLAAVPRRGVGLEVIQAMRYPARAKPARNAFVIFA